MLLHTQANAMETYVLLDLRLLLLLLEDLPVDLLALFAEVLNALDELVVVVLKSRTLLRHDGPRGLWMSKAGTLVFAELY